MTNRSDATFSLLLVDDSATGRAAIAAALRVDGRFEVTEARGGEAFARLLAERRFDLVVTELAPWDMAELEVLDRARSLAIGPAVVVVTGDGSEQWAVEAMKRGAADYLARGRGYLKQLPERLVAAARTAESHVARGDSHGLGVDGSLGLLCVVGSDGYIKRWNPAWVQTFGYSHEEIMAIPAAELLHPDDLPRIVELGAALRQGVQVSAVEMRVRCKDGSYKWLLWNAVPSVETGVYYASGQDITSRKQIEEQLRESQERFQLIATATQECVWDWDLRLNRVWRNEAYLKTFGAPNDAVDGTIEWWVSRIHPEDRERVVAAMPPPLVDGRQQWAMEYRLRRADGQYAHVYDRGFVIFNPEGEPVRMVGSLMDISELKNAEELLRQSEERFRLASKATRDAIWDWDLRRDEVWRSEGFQTLFGYQPEEIGNSFDWWLERVHEDDRQQVVAQIPVPGDTDLAQCAFEYRFRRADGTYADVIDRGFVMYGADGTPMRIVGTITDMSQRRRAEELLLTQHAELAHMARLSTMGEVATGLAHELNQPLTAIANYAESCAGARRRSG